jgi:hypothetical protein
VIVENESFRQFVEEVGDLHPWVTALAGKDITPGRSADEKFAVAERRLMDLFHQFAEADHPDATYTVVRNLRPTAARATDALEALVQEALQAGNPELADSWSQSLTAMRMDPGTWMSTNMQLRTVSKEEASRTTSVHIFTTKVTAETKNQQMFLPAGNEAVGRYQTILGFPAAAQSPLEQTESSDQARADRKRRGPSPTGSPPTSEASGSPGRDFKRQRGSSEDLQSRPSRSPSPDSTRLEEQEPPSPVDLPHPPAAWLRPRPSATESRPPLSMSTGTILRPIVEDSDDEDLLSPPPAEYRAIVEGEEGQDDYQVFLGPTLSDSDFSERFGIDDFDDDFVEIPVGGSAAAPVRGSRYDSPPLSPQASPSSPFARATRPVYVDGGMQTDPERVSRGTQTDPERISRGTQTDPERISRGTQTNSR